MDLMVGGVGPVQHPTQTGELGSQEGYEQPYGKGRAEDERSYRDDLPWVPTSYLTIWSCRIDR